MKVHCQIIYNVDTARLGLGYIKMMAALFNSFSYNAWGMDHDHFDSYLGIFDSMLATRL